MASRKSRRDRQPEPDPAPASEPRPTSARKELYDRILTEINEGFATYAQAHPERVGDERWQDAKACSIEGVAGLLALLEEYAVEFHVDVQARERELEACKAELVTLRARAVELQAEIAALETDTPHLDALWGMGPTAGPLLLRLAAVLKREAEERKDGKRVQDLERWLEARDA